MSDQKKTDGASQTALLIVGIVLIVMGIAMGGQRVAPGVFEPLRDVLAIIGRLWWPLVIIGAGVLILVSANRDKGAPGQRTAKLYRSRSDRMVSGVLGGLGAYFGIDPTWIRIGVVLATLATGGWGMVIAYLIAATIVPEEPLPGEAVSVAAPPAPPTEPAPPAPPAEPGAGSPE